MASVKMKLLRHQVVVLSLGSVILFCLIISQSNALRFGEKARTLHGPYEKNHQLPALMLSKDDFKPSSNLKPVANAENLRLRRSKTVDQKQLISVFALNDSHEQLSVHWAGKGSNVVICLARNRKQEDGDTSAVYVSNDLGGTFTQKSLRLSQAKDSLIAMFYISPVANSRYIFTDTVHKYIFTTKDYGKTFQNTMVKFKPDILSLHPTDPEIILGMEKHDDLKKLWFSDNFGITWKTIAENVKTFFWGEAGVDPPETLFVQRQEPGRPASTLMSTNSFFQNEQRKKILISDIEDVEIRGKYLFATKQQHLLGSKTPNGTLQLWVSYNRKDFFMARFPNTLEKQDFYIADASEDQVFACVMHTPKVTNLYISNPEGTEFSLSLERILYFSPAGAGKDLWTSDEPIVDLHKVEGLRGIYIATQLRQDFVSKLKEKSTLVGVEEGDVGDGLSSVITFNKGGDWNPLRPPKVDSRGKSTHCSSSANCSLHVTQKFNQVYPRSRTPPILSRASAPGLILASGVVGSSLKGHPSLFVSSDAGLNWHQVLYGNYLYSMGDHGGLIVAAEYYNEAGYIGHIMYSIDEGEHFTRQNIYHLPSDVDTAKLKIYGLMTEPGEKTTVFTLFGSNPDHHEWLLIKVDLKSTFDKPCSSEDYKRWSPHGFGKSCLLGRKDVYERRMPRISCFNGEDYIRPVLSENCPCSREDYQCDFGFEEDATKMCVRDASSNFNPFRIPHPCPEDTSYNKTKGYRLASGDLCIGREKSGFEPDFVPCPIKDESEFLLFAQRQQISRIPLNGDNEEKDKTSWEKLPLEDLKNVIAVDYDFRDKCVFWADIDEDKIMRLCLEDGHSNDGDEREGKPEVLVETGLDSVEGLAFDWVSRNLYFVDGQLKKIEAIMVDLHNSGRMRRTILNSTFVEKPRGIALNPYKGYMFISDWSDKNPRISRTELDGTNLKVLFDSSVVAWPNGIAVDFQDNKIYWADAKKDYIASSDYDGLNLKYILRGRETVPHPFAVGIYKDWLYFDDWNRFEIGMCSKYDGSGLKVLARNVLGAMDMKVFSKLSTDGRLGTNICSNRTAAKCSHLCMAKPGGERSCLCPDGMVITKLAFGNENCTCPDGETSLPDGKCSSVSSTCASDQFECSDKKCVPNLWHCDGDKDCTDGSDERDCGISSCDSSQFQCKGSSRCVPSTWRCDVDKDCADGSDEENCHYPTCAPDQFSCKNGRCVDKKYVCDFDDDCRDNSDESDCSGSSGSTSCQPAEFSCLTSNGGTQCLPLSWRCDGDKDCPDSSDEKNCTANTCQPWQMRCKNGRCISTTWHCDGENDCLDNSDEVDCETKSTSTPTTPTTTPRFGTCSSWMFTCTNKICIPYWWRCDSVDDCGDNSDEVMCQADASTLPPPSNSTTPIPSDRKENCGINRFRCNSGKCIWDSWLCDQSPDCEDGEDEKNCEEKKSCDEDHFRCERSSGCIPKTDVCNGKDDCGDASDELGCSLSGVTPVSITCGSSDFTCGTGECIGLYERCDGHSDCLDGSDEIHCDEVAEIIHVRDLRVDYKSIKPASFNLTWLPPLSANGILYEYLPSYHEMNSLENQWTNTTWTDKNYQKLNNLVPGTLYKLTLYVRMKTNPKKEFATANYIEATTLAAAPSPPSDISLVQIPSERTVVVQWKKPDKFNGRISQYKIYFTPPFPPYIVNVPSSSDNQYKVNFKFDPGTNYSFWVTASSEQLESMNSHVAYIVFAKDAVIDPVRNLISVKETNNSISLTWDPPESFTEVPKGNSNAASASTHGYSVTYKASYLADNYNWTVRNCTDTKITLTELPPGAKHVIKVAPFKKLFMGPETRLDVSTTGDLLPIVSGIKSSANGTNVNISWSQPKDKRKAHWEYGIFNVPSADLPPIFMTKTKSTSTVLTGLDACVYYSFDVRLIGPYGLGSSKGLSSVTTEFDKKAPPKNVNVVTTPGNPSSAQVRWNSACQQIDQNIAYKVTVYDKNLKKTQNYLTKPTRETELNENITVHWGGEYEVFIQTDAPNSRTTSSLLFRAHPLPIPTQVDAIPEQNGSLYIRWKEIDWPKELASHNFTYLVFIGHDESMNKVKTYNISKPPFVVNAMEREVPYYVAVSVQDEHGYKSQLSEISSAAYPAEAQAMVFSTSNIVSIVVPIVLIIVGLAAALGFYVTRHKRLQRSFMSFANSHYDTRSGSATFTTGQDDEHLDEDDSPMIRGFSDDEPLVIA